MIQTISGRKLFEIRTKFGYSCRKLAGILGVTHPTLANLETSKEVPIKYVRVLCEKLKLSEEDLLNF